MIYRTRTYIAADWENDKEAVEILQYWNKSQYWGLSFGDAHELSQCRNDDTNNCNIKRNCSQNLEYSKNFILIIGNNTKNLRAGYCMYCKAYNYCTYTYKTNKSFIEYECDYARRNQLPAIVLYNSYYVDKSKCIDTFLDIAKCHAPMLKHSAFGTLEWDYQAVKRAFELLR